MLKTTLLTALLLLVASAALAQITISGETTWRLADSPVVVGDIHVADGGTLIIEAGVEVLFNDGANFLVESGGRLVTQGTAQSPVRVGLWTGQAYWAGMRCQPGSSVEMTHTVIEAGGGEFMGPCVFLQSSDATLVDVTVRCAPHDALMVAAEDISPILSRVTCEDNWLNGVVFLGDRCSPRVSGLSSRRNGGWGLVTALSSTPVWLDTPAL